AGFVEAKRPHDTFPGETLVHLRFLTGVQRLEMMWKQQLARFGAGSRQEWLRLHAKLQCHAVIGRGISQCYRLAVYVDRGLRPGNGRVVGLRVDDLPARKRLQRSGSTLK